MRKLVSVGAALVAAFLFWLGAHRAQASALEARASWPAAEDFLLVPPANVAPFIYAGYGELAADITWARTLVYYGSSTIGESDFRYLHRLIDNVLTLDPYYHRVYGWAAAASTYKQARATQEEFETAIVYLRRGIEVFPTDYDLHHALVMKLWWDLAPEDRTEVRKNRIEAARIAERAMRLPTAPPGAATRIAQMWSDLGELEHARETLRQMLLTTENKQARAKMIKRFRDLAASTGEAELLERVKRKFDDEHAEYLPYAPPDLFVLLGPRLEAWKSVDELSAGTLLSELREIADEDEVGDDASGRAASPTKTVPSP